MKILAIGAHPDDIEIFMFGFLSCCKKRGDDIAMIVATDGCLGGNLEKDELIKIRANETRSALSYISVPTLLNIPDGQLGDNISHKQIIKDHIEKINPELIVTHSCRDYHSDHINLSKIVQEIASHNIPLIFCDTMMGVNFSPNYYIDITEHFSIKSRAIMHHESQTPIRFVNLAKMMNSFRSAQCNAPLGCFAEAYYVKQKFPFTEISSILPPSPPVRSFNIENINGFL